jgi:uncharacterized protein with FMN-binding domain
MKKFILSFILIIGFTAYAVFQRRTGIVSQNPVLVSSITAPPASSQAVTIIPATSAPATTLASSSASTVQPSAASTQAAVQSQPNSTKPNLSAVAKSSPAPAPVASPAPVPAPAPAPTGQYKDGKYTGSVADAYYGNLQVQAVITGGKLANVIFLDYPQDRSYSVDVNTQAMPLLTQEALVAQSANVNVVSGATQSSMAFVQSLGAALAQAKN